MNSLLKPLLSVVKDIFTFFNPSNKKGLIRFVLLVALVVVGIKFLGTDAQSEETEVAAVPLVHVASLQALQSDSLFELVGSVEAISQAELTTEASGRVTSVRVALGDTISAGTVVATLENDSQYAALLQAEGAYEAALAAAAKSDVGVTSAETSLLAAQNSAITSYQNAYTAVTSFVYADVDQIFKDPTDVTPAVRIDGGAYTKTLNTTRYELNTKFDAWRTIASTLVTSDDLESALTTAIADTTEVLSMTDMIIERLTVNADEYETTDFSGLRASLLAGRNTLNGTLANLQGAKTALVQAKDGVTQAELSGTNAELSTANAQVKQALGSLRAAQANYSNTIVTSPIAGVVNVLDIKTGDYVGMQQLVASVANNDALEITVFVGEGDASLLTLGQTVVIDGKYDGTVTNIAPAINPSTKKVEVKIQTESEEIANGDTVTVSLTRNETPEDDTAPLSVPLTAVKFTATDGSVFVVEDGKLVAKPVTLGAVSGSSVVIESGLERGEVIVIDARGLSAGQEVEALTK